jgi:hypothetical protein
MFSAIAADFETSFVVIADFAPSAAGGLSCHVNG